MRKYLLSCLLLGLCSYFSWGQLSETELRQEFDRMEAQMLQSLKQMQETLENGQFLQSDTAFFRVFPFGGATEPGLHPQGDPLQLQQLLDQFMGQLTEEDWAEIERLFDEFQQVPPIPENGEIAPESEESKPALPEKRKKKSKVYSL